MGPWTVAQWVLVCAGREAPSGRCQVTLGERLVGDGREEARRRLTYVQSSWWKTSLKKGTPAMMPLN